MHSILVVAWHLCTGSRWWRGTCVLDSGGGMAPVQWILVVSCTGVLDPGGGVAIVHWILVVA